MMGMQPHRVVVGPELTFSPVFNAAVAFVDRHLREGNGDRIALHTAEGEAISYRDLAVWTERSVKSQWVKNEALEGMDRGILVPIKQRHRPSRDFSTTRFFGSLR